jgi:phage-related protein
LERYELRRFHISSDRRRGAFYAKTAHSELWINRAPQRRCHSRRKLQAWTAQQSHSFGSALRMPTLRSSLETYRTTSATDFGELKTVTCHSTQNRLKVLGGAGVVELIQQYRGDTYRAIYTVRIRDRICVLHCFQKKASSGIKTSKQDLETIKRRLAEAEELHAK